MEENHDNPLEFHRMHHPTNIVELNKKRKFIDKQLGLPAPKHRFRDRDTSEHLSSYAGKLQNVLNTLVKEERMNVGEKRLEQCDLAKDCTSSIGKSVPAISQYAEAESTPQFPKVYTLEQTLDPASTLSNIYACDKPSTSSGSCGSVSPKNDLYPFSSRNIEKTTREKDDPCAGDKQYSEFVEHAYYNCSKLEANEIEEFIDDESSMMLYSNGATPDMFVLSSGRWDANADIPMDTRKPTIDKEFEEYFSTLML